MIKPLLATLILSAPPLAAEIVTRPYTALETRLSDRIDFETLPRRAEPGHNLDHPLRHQGAWLGEAFAGLTVSTVTASNGSPHDTTVGQPTAPLRIRPGAAGHNLAVAFHRGFGSNAVFPLGPDGFAEIPGRGEGALAVVFDQEQGEVGLKIHAAYPSPLGGDTTPGVVTIWFFARNGQLIGRHDQTPAPGVNAWGFADTERRIGGIVVTNTDPGGIALDDILFQITPMLF